MKLSLLFGCCLAATVLSAQNALPEIDRLTASLDQATRTLTITYDLTDSDDTEVEVTFLVSDDEGRTFSLATENATGDVGFPVAPGMGKTISWDTDGRLTGTGDYRIELVADDRYEIDIQTIVDQVDSNRLRGNLEFMSGIRHFREGPVQLAAVKDSLERAFRAAGLATSRQPVPFGNYTGENIIGDLAGTSRPDQVYIVDAHFDTVEESPGADDNGSGVAGVLEALRVLAPYRFQRTLRFIGFDLEEVGLVGSRRYVRNDIPATDTIAGVFNLEMLGYYTEEPNSQTFPFGFELLYPELLAEIEADEFRGNFIINVGDPNSAALLNAYADAAVRYVPDLKVASMLTPENWQTLTPDFGRGDHAIFWRSNIPALMLTGGANFRNPNYHTPADLVETLNFTFMHRVVKAVVGAMASEAGILHATAATADFSVSTGTNAPLDCAFQLTPQPADDHLQIRFGACAHPALDLALFDAAGRRVRDLSLRPTSGSLVELDLNDLAAGVYFLRLGDGVRVVGERVVVR